MGAENLNPFEELKNLDRQVDLVTDLAALRPIFHRLDEIAKENPSDFEVQLVVGDIKQHLVNRGSRLKEQLQAAPPTLAPTVVPRPAQPAGPSSDTAHPATLPDLKPTKKLMSSGQFVTKPVLPDIPTAPAMPISPSVSAAPTVPPPLAVPVSSAQAPRSLLPLPPLEEGLLSATGQAPPSMLPQGPLPQAPREAPRSEPAEARADTPKVLRQPPRALKPPSPPNWKRALFLGALAGAVISITLIAFLVNQARKRNRRPPVTAAAAQIDITTMPAGALIRIASASPGLAGPEVQCTSDCKVALAPGSYQVTAFLDGFQPATSPLTVAVGQPALVDLTLMPQSQSLRILTDLDQGKVAFDDQPPVDLQEGQLVLDDVKPGTHTVKLTSRNSAAAFTFDIADAKPPAVTGTVTARNLAAVLVSSFGTQARVVTNSGPLKLALNGQPQGDVGPEGIELKDFQPGVDEIVVGEGKDQRNVKESFGPAPMLTAFLKSDVNAGTLIVSTGEDDVRVFVNSKEYRLRTKRGQVRIQTLGNVSVRVAKDGFQEEPTQTAEVRKGSETRLEFKLKAAPQLGGFLIRGGTPGAEVLLDDKSVGSLSADGGLTDNTVTPGDHVIELKRDQYAPKKFQRTIKAGQIVVFTGADAVLAAANGVIKLARTPAAAAVTYHRADEAETHDFRGNQIDLPPGAYVFSAKAPGFVDYTERVQLAGGETRTLEINLTRERAPAPVVAAGIGDFEDPSAWRKDGELWIHKGAGFIPFKPTPKGVFTFTAELLKGGSVFRGGRIRWAMQYVDAKNYLLFELDKKNFWAEVVENGKKLEREKTQIDLEKQKAFTIEIDVTPERLIHKVRQGDDWTTLDSFSEPGRNFTQGKFGFLIQGNDEIGISDFKFVPK